MRILGTKRRQLFFTNLSRLGRGKGKGSELNFQHFRPAGTSFCPHLSASCLNLLALFSPCHPLKNLLPYLHVRDIEMAVHPPDSFAFPISAL